MKYRVLKKRLHQRAGRNSYSKSRHLFKRLRMRHTHPWLMAGDLKFYMRAANFPITKADTIWTAYLRLKRIHHRQIQYRVVRTVEMERCMRSILESIEKKDVMEVITSDHKV